MVVIWQSARIAAAKVLLVIVGSVLMCRWWSTFEG